MDSDMGVVRLVWSVSSACGNKVTDSFAGDVAHLVSKSGETHIRCLLLGHHNRPTAYR